MPFRFHTLSLKSAAIALATSGALAVASLGCSPDQLQSKDPPTGAGGFNPTGGTTVGSSSSGMGSVGGGGSGGSGGGMVTCDEALRRCEHEFTYPDAGESSVELRGDWDGPATWEAGAPMSKNSGVWSVTVSVPYNGEVQYKLILNGNNWITDPNNPETFDDGNGNVNSLYKGGTCDPYTCSAPPVVGYDWRDAVLYFVFIDRFLDGNPANNGNPSGAFADAEYKGGDYAGLLKKIEAGYFTDLGVNALWITVPMQNPNNKEIGSDGKYYSAYHGYWPSDLEKTEEHFGSLAELNEVVEAAHAKNIKVIIDYAMNHVHKSAPAYAQHSDWFWPNSNGNGGNCVCGEGCSWDDAAQARRCWFRDYLPDFNFTNAEARKFSVDNAIWWIKNTGIDGYRLDAVKHIETSWITDLRSRVTTEIEPDSGNHFYMVGETFTGNKGQIKEYVNPVTKLDGQFDFPLRIALTRTVLMRKAPMSELADFLGANDTYYGAGSVMSTFIGNHDMPRAIHFAQDQPLYGDEWAGGQGMQNLPGLPAGTSAFERLANAFTVLFTIKGIPLVYYGDEIGLPGAGDPDNRRFMQWSGYSPGQQGLFNHLKKLTKIRADNKALSRGTRTTLGVTNETLAYKMTSAEGTIFVVVNRGDSQQSVGGLPGGALTDLLTNASVNGPSVTVPARSSMILKQ